jgi:hypothetical protein
MLRRLRRRFGIAAPRVAIKPHVPWYWRVASTIVVLAFGLALAGWIYDAGRSIAGYDRSESNQQIEGMKIQIDQLNDELGTLRQLTNVSESSLQIERTAQQELSQQVKRLERENSQLKEELAVFESLAGRGPKSATPGISSFDLEFDPASGRCRFRLLLTAGTGGPERAVEGRLQLALNVIQNGKPAMLIFPSATELNGAPFNVSFHRYLRQQGSVQLPIGATITEAEAKLLIGNSVVAAKKAIL